MAGCPAQIRQLEHHLSSVPTLERGRGLGDRGGNARRGHGGQRPLQHRQHHSSRPCLGSGRKRGTRAPDAFLADKGYDADTIRADLAERKIKPVIPGRSNRRVKIEYDRALYKQRNRIERMFGHLKINRAIATRYDQLANSFLGMVYLATARYWLKFVHAA